MKAQPGLGAAPSTVCVGDDMEQPTCALDDCERPRQRREWCSAHYRRWLLYGDPSITRFKPSAGCAFPECPRPIASGGLCGSHDDQRRAGKELQPIAEYRPTAERDEHGRKMCRSCREWKPIEEFHRVRTRGDGYVGHCKPCGRWAKILSHYGMTAADYESMLESQGGGCAVCGRLSDDNGRPLAVDHDHACCPGKRSCGRCVRGLLCNNCNHGIGLFEDNPERLMRAASYLKERHGSGDGPV